MTLMRITLNLAFHECVKADLDSVRRTIVNHAIDGLEAEVTFTSDCQERTIALADPDYESDSADAAVENWQERAREELGAMATKEAA